MKFIEKEINESHIDEITELVQGEKGMMSLDMEDVRCILESQECVLYQAEQEEGEENSSFMSNFFSEMKKKEPIQTCTSLLLCVGMSQEEPLMMDDRDVIDDFVYSFENENMEIKWGMKINPEGCRMTLVLVCSK